MHWALVRLRRVGRRFNVVHVQRFLEMTMGKYVVAWILGVPTLVLVAVYFFMH